MIRHYIKLAFRNLIRQKTYSIINIMGLALGMGCAILVIIYVKDDLNFDKSHKNINEIYRVIAETTEGSEKVFSSRNPIPIATALKDEFPEIINSTRYDAIGEFFDVKYEDKIFKDYAAVADSNFFDVLTFNFIEGNSKTALRNPHDVVLTKEMAKKYFGKKSALGKVLNIRNTDFTVAGVIDDFTFNTHIYFQYLISYSYWFEDVGMPSNIWRTPGPACTSYLLLQKGSDYKSLERKIDGVVNKYAPESTMKLSLQAFKKIHLYSSFIRNDGSNFAAGNIKDLYTFSALGIFLILIACINFMNLATARSLAKSREVGVRKVMGAHRKQLIKQFIGEALVPAVIAYIIAMLGVEFLLKGFNDLALRNLSINYLDINLLLYLLTLIVLTALISGSYPAFMLSRFHPVKVLSSFSQSGKKGSALRKVLVVLQFSISIFLIIGTIIINKQINFIKNQDLGWDQHNLVNIHVGSDFNNNWETIREELLSYPDIVDVSKDASLPVFIADPETNFEWEGKTPDQNVSLFWYVCGYEYFKTFKMEIINGRSFSRDFVSDSSNFILNEEAVKAIGLQNPVGKRFSIRSLKGEIIGVVKNFHQTSLHNKIQPLVLSMPPRGGYNLAVRIKPENVDKTVEYLTEIWQKYGPGTPIQLDFMEEWVDNLYQNEKRDRKIFNIFSMMAIFISCLGLFGLASYITEQKSKEIGIRKTLGASIGAVVVLLSKEFSKWVLLSNIIAWPAIWYFMNKWLQNFEFKIEMSWWIFVTGGIIALLIALITVSTKTFQAAIQNPVDTLRYE